MAWTEKEINDQCRRLEPEDDSDTWQFFVLAYQDGGGLSVFLFNGFQTQCFENDDEIVETLMTSDKFDRDLFVTLRHNFAIDVRTLLEICLS